MACADAERLDLPLVIGEVGVRRDVPGMERYLSDIYDALDDARVGAVYWDMSSGGRTSYGLFDAEGHPSEQARLVARPYPERIAGTPESWDYASVDGVFVATWNEDGTATGDTTIALPSLAFPNGQDIEIDPPGPFTVDGNVLYIDQIGGERRVTITRREAVAESLPASTR